MDFSSSEIESEDSDPDLTLKSSSHNSSTSNISTFEMDHFTSDDHETVEDDEVSLKKELTSSTSSLTSISSSSNSLSATNSSASSSAISSVVYSTSIPSYFEFTNSCRNPSSRVLIKLPVDLSKFEYECEKVFEKVKKTLQKSDKILNRLNIFSDKKKKTEKHIAFIRSVPSHLDMLEGQIHNWQTELQLFKDEFLHKATLLYLEVSYEIKIFDEHLSFLNCLFKSLIELDYEILKELTELKNSIDFYQDIMRLEHEESLLEGIDESYDVLNQNLISLDELRCNPEQEEVKDPSNTFKKSSHDWNGEEQKRKNLKYCSISLQDIIKNPEEVTSFLNSSNNSTINSPPSSTSSTSSSTSSSLPPLPPSSSLSSAFYSSYTLTNELYRRNEKKFYRLSSILQEQNYLNLDLTETYMKTIKKKLNNFFNIKKLFHQLFYKINEKQSIEIYNIKNLKKIKNEIEKIFELFDEKLPRIDEDFMTSHEKSVHELTQSTLQTLNLNNNNNSSHSNPSHLVSTAFTSSSTYSAGSTGPINPSKEKNPLINKTTTPSLTSSPCTSSNSSRPSSLTSFLFYSTNSSPEKLFEIPRHRSDSLESFFQSSAADCINTLKQIFVFEKESKAKLSKLSKLREKTNYFSKKLNIS